MATVTRKLKLLSTDWCYTPGMFKWVREAIAPFDRAKAIEVLQALGVNEVDAKWLANPSNKPTEGLEGEHLLLTFERAA